MNPQTIMIASLFALCIITGGCGGGGQEPEQLKNLAPDFPVLTPVAATLEETLDNYLNKNQADNKAGISILVRKDGQVVYHKSRGMANVSQSLAVDNSTGFHVAALSKTFTALAIMQLYEKGQLQLNASILDYLPELPEIWRPITIDMMLSHQSGMSDYIMDAPNQQILQNINNQQVIDYFIQHPALKFLPGSQSEYNNSAYIFLAEIIARISGMSFNQYMEINIFTPAGMTDSYINDDLTPLKTTDALNYGLRDDWYGIHIYTQGDTNQVGSTNDVNAFVDALSKEKIVSTNTLYLMAQLHTVIDQKGYGYGWMIDGEIDFKPRVSNGGAHDGYRSTLVIDTAYNLEYAVLACDGEKSTIDQTNIRLLIEKFYKIN